MVPHNRREMSWNLHYHLICATLKCTQELDKQQKYNGADIAALATNFKQTADALGGKVQAALAFDKIKMFLNMEEKKELQQLKHEQYTDQE